MLVKKSTDSWQVSIIIDYLQGGSSSGPANTGKAFILKGHLQVFQISQVFLVLQVLQGPFLKGHPHVQKHDAALWVSNGTGCASRCKPLLAALGALANAAACKAKEAKEAGGAPGSAKDGAAKDGAARGGVAKRKVAGSRSSTGEGSKCKGEEGGGRKAGRKVASTGVRKG